jgi:hydroxymethylbilane synthase
VVKKKLILATRKSPLALAQTEQVAAHLSAALGCEIELLKIVTTGDARTEWSLEKQGGKGLFTKELEEALLRGEADVAVHSCKDLPGVLPDGLAVAGYLPREDPRDILVLRDGVETPALIATSSPRRRLQLAMLFPDAQFTEIRGNVDTRLRKIGQDHVADATVLAAAGLRRLGIGGWKGVSFHAFGPEHMVPAVGQAAIALQTRTADAARLAEVLDKRTARAVTLERAFQRCLGAGCQTAFAAHVTADTLWFYHQEIGLRSLPLSDAEIDAPEQTARAMLKHFGFQA